MRAQNALHGVGKPAEETRAVERVQSAVDQGDQPDEGDQHGADVEGQLQAVAGAARGGVDDIDAGLFHFHL